MKIFLVGGAVRDELLNYPTQEKDWVVVGTTPEEMLALGFERVGKDFPVFLHPDTKEEYALARTERKTSSGYYGFACDYNETVTLEEDLGRRDLTINAIARDTQGKLIDPYHGADDLKNKIIRHVSPAFIEDPVRVLRVARFMARFCHLGFKLAEETRFLMYKMVKDAELNALVPERIWQEWFKSLQERNPEVFIQVLRTCGALAIVLPELDNLFGIPNPHKYHPEVDSGVHSLMVLQEAVKLSEEPVVRFAALVHDLGKALTPMSEWPKHYQHDKRGIIPIRQLCARLRMPGEYKELALLATREHLKLARLRELRPRTILKILESCDALRRPERFKKLLLIAEADGKGKAKVKDRAIDRTIDKEKEKEEGKVNKPNATLFPHQAWLSLVEICRKLDVSNFIQQGLKGEAMKTALYNQRIDLIKEQLLVWKKNER